MKQQLPLTGGQLSKVARDSWQMGCAYGGGGGGVVYARFSTHILHKTKLGQETYRESPRWIECAWDHWSTCCVITTELIKHATFPIKNFDLKSINFFKKSVYHVLHVYTLLEVMKWLKQEWNGDTWKVIHCNRDIKKNMFSVSGISDLVGHKVQDYQYQFCRYKKLLHTKFCSGSIMFDPAN